MWDHTDLFDHFPELPDEAVIAINNLIEELYWRFQNHYYAQMHRYDQQHRELRDPLMGQLPLPLTDPSDSPF